MGNLRLWPHVCAVALFLGIAAADATEFDHRATLSARATCSYRQVVSGDSCSSLATKCKITDSQFMSYNTKPNLCSTLAVGQYVCCSSGSLPDFTPKQNSDGSCATYTVQSGDYCDRIAQQYSIQTSDVENYNKQTWGWQGCDNVQTGSIICLSSGTPPMPASVSNAICGPQVPGTAKPSNWSMIASLNPCPLNACCDIWGQCGTTPDFCTVSQSKTGAPGTSAPGTAGCISNCGTNIANNAQAPASFFKIGYFEAWGATRSCLNMDATQIPSGYSHIHFAFGEITDDFQVDLSSVQDQFTKFAGMSGFKRILSFGGWSFSTEGDSYPIFRKSVTAANRQTFANSVVAVVKKYNLDGVDFDWEYPGAPDIPGIPPGSPQDGANYLSFLKTLRPMMPSGTTISMAAPASYWYLKGFPISDMAPVLDYIVYMTYDLHGQWDYNNQWANPGCPSGNCLRSHVNLTETMFALAMITKAGVPANKIMVGVSSYGRAFGMTDSSCTGPSCLFNGPDSSAIKGACTQEAGYIADAEINYFISQGAQSYHDDGLSDSDIVVYKNTWVAYMSPSTKNRRASIYQRRNFGGTVDWAIDLEGGSMGGNNTGGGSPNGVGIIPIPGCTTLAAGATLTLSARCATAIANLPPSGQNNQPSGPSFCSSGCTLWQKITGTCCGFGGTLGNPVVVLPNVQLPAPMPLAQGFNPSAPITINATTFPAGVPLPYPITIPKGTNIPDIVFPRTSIPANQALPAALLIPAGAIPSAPFTVNGQSYPADTPLKSSVNFPAGYNPSAPIVFPTFVIPAGAAPFIIVLPLGYIPFSPIAIPPVTFPANSPIPLPVQVPPGQSFPAPLSVPAGAPLVVPPPGVIPANAPPAAPVSFPVTVTECYNLPKSLTYTPPTTTKATTPKITTPPPTTTAPYKCDSTVTTSTLKCINDCCGYIPCPQWCNYYCGGHTCGKK